MAGTGRCNPPQENGGAEELSLGTPSLRLAAQGWGPPAARPVLALHGWLDNAASFARLAPRLPGLRLVALDLPGHGLSQHRPPGTLYHFVDFVGDALAAADALGWQRFSLLGHSLGAAIAAFLAAVAPARVERLVLVEGLGPRAGEPGRAPKQLAESLAEQRALAARRAPRYPNLEAATRARAAAGPIAADAARILAARGLRETVSGGLEWRADPRLRVRSPVYLTEPQVLAFLRRIDAPALLVRARSGLLHEPPHPQRCEAVPRLDVVDLTGGHHLHLESPRESAAAIARFLGEA